MMNGYRDARGSFSRIALLLLFSLALTVAGRAQDRIQPPDADVSLKLEIERAISRGVAYLESTQNPDTGSWSDPQYPALTALPVVSIVSDPNRQPGAALPESAKKAYGFILSNEKADGGIYGKGLATYNTALSVLALSLSGEEEHLPVIARASRLLINQQQDFDRRGEVDNLFDGGIGYGGSYAHSDLSNTHFAIEALHYARQALADTEYAEPDFELDWDAAIQFVSACQNTDETIERLGDWATLREEDRGGFVYFPGNTKSEEIAIEVDGEERTALRSYGSMSYAGLLSFIYAEMDREDPRIALALDWLGKNYTLEENPGMDAQGLFYYYHTMAKALSVGGISRLRTPEGGAIDWRRELALKIMSEQSPDGSWINRDSNRWMEDDPALVTSYALISLAHIYRGL